jgi:hypothetical protein
MDVYEDLGIRSTFNVEVLQQLAFERYAGCDSWVRAGRDAWRRTVVEMVERGFDVQLHIHPQWYEAELVDGWWKLDSRWHLVDYPISSVGRMVEEAVAYLQPLLGARQLTCFRAGAWGLGPPSRPILSELAKRGIRVDTSVVDGIVYNGKGIKLDYSQLDCPHFPYIPDIDDVRRVASGPANAADLIELPTQSVPRLSLARKLAGSLWRRHRFTAMGDLGTLGLGYVKSRPSMGGVMHLLRQLRGKDHRVPDFVMRDPFGFDANNADSEVIVDLSSAYSALSFEHMVDICVERASRSPGGRAVLVFGNHTKDLQRPESFRRVERVIRYIQTRYPAAAFRTLADVVQQLDDTFTVAPGFKVGARSAASSMGV